MAILETEAVVLKGWKLGETSKILSLYTHNFGKVRVLAKGARGPKSKFKGCLEPLTHIRIIYYDKKTRDLQLLSKTDLVDPHYKIIGDPLRTALGLAEAELIERIMVGDESFPQVFHLLTDTLDSINSVSGFLESIFWFFEGHLIDLMGYKPTWNHCLSCQISLGDGGGYFQPVSGGLLCPRCGSHQGGLHVDAETLEILFFLQREKLNEVTKLKPTLSQKAEIRKMFDLYFKTHIDHMKNLKSLKLYYQFEEGYSLYSSKI